MYIEPLEPRIAPATITIYTLADTETLGKITLRQALNGASYGDVIKFAAGLHGTIKLGSQGSLAISTKVTIDGLSTVVNGTSHNAITISGAGQQQILKISGTGDVAINNINFTNGVEEGSGGAIYSSNTYAGGVTITGCAFTKNVAEGSVNVTFPFSGGGGALFIGAGSVNLLHSKLSGNHAIGGASFTTGTAGLGGAVYIDHGATGVFIYDQFTGNTAIGHNGASGGGAGLGGALENRGTLKLYDSTFSGNVAVAGSGQSGSGASGANAIGGAIYSAGNSYFLGVENVFAHNKAQASSGASGIKSDAVSTGVAGESGSQGGYGGRAYGGAIDIEGTAKIFDSTITGNLAIGGNGGNGSAGGPGGASQGTTKEGVGGNGGNAGNGGDGYGGGIDSDGSNLSLSLSTSIISGNMAKAGKGGIGGAAGAGGHSATPPRRGGDGHVASGVGGGLAAHTDVNSVSLSEDTISNNTATALGGGVDFYSVKALTISDSTISGNHSAKGGGVMIVGKYSGTSVSTISNSTISGNSAIHEGGGIFNYNATLNLEQSTIAGNSATYGGGVYLYNNGTAKIDNCTIAFNKAIKTGGGVMVLNSTAAFVSTVVADNSLKHVHIYGADVLGTASAVDSAFGNSSGLTISNLGGANLQNENFLLKSLHNNGGTTETILFTVSPKASSALLDAGSNPLGFMDDQRGNLRDLGGVDIGAVEMDPV